MAWPLPMTIFYVANGGKVGLYNASSGLAVDSNFISGLNTVTGLAVIGDLLYVEDSGLNKVGLYNATTGAAMNTSFITGLNNPFAISVVAVPEPASWVVALATFGFLLVSFWRRRLSRA
jgi:PEP-CTERM motif